MPNNETAGVEKPSAATDGTVEYLALQEDFTKFDDVSEKEVHQLYTTSKRNVESKLALMSSIEHMMFYPDKTSQTEKCRLIVDIDPDYPAYRIRKITFS